MRFAAGDGGRRPGSGGTVVHSTVHVSKGRLVIVVDTKELFVVADVGTVMH